MLESTAHQVPEPADALLLRVRSLEERLALLEEQLVTARRMIQGLTSDLHQHVLEDATYPRPAPVISPPGDTCRPFPPWPGWPKPYIGDVPYDTGPTCDGANSAGTTIADNTKVWAGAEL